MVEERLRTFKIGPVSSLLTLWISADFLNTDPGQVIIGDQIVVK